MVYHRTLTRLSGSILLIVFAFIAFHAPISVFFGQFLPEVIVKSWKEILLLIALPLIFVISIRKNILARLSKDVLLRMIVVYAGIHLILMCFLPGAFLQKLAGLAIDLRFMLFFVLVYVFLNIAPHYRNIFIKTGIISGSLALIFAFAQVTMLPHDFLKHLGYSKATIAPYLTVDQNPNFIRINGTLRGPNPLGVFTVFGLLLGASFVSRIKKPALDVKVASIIGTLVMLTILWFTYSRSAIIGLVIGLAAIIFVRFAKKFTWQYGAVALAVVMFSAVALFAFKDSHFIQNVVFHNNPVGGSVRDSDDNHASSLEDGTARMLRQPFGAGIGSTGSASLYGDKPLVIENQYLFVAHETGWIGLGLFIAIIAVTLQRLYKQRRDWLSLGVFASGLAWVAIGFIQPVMVDDTVSLIWWGFAAIALATYKKGES